jgi:predicted HicB family RNase H-like nuclease
MPRLPPSKDSTAMNFFLPAKLHSKLKGAAALRQISMQDLTIEILEREIDKELAAAMKSMSNKTKG